MDLHQDGDRDEHVCRGTQVASGGRQGGFGDRYHDLFDAAAATAAAAAAAAAATAALAASTDGSAGAGGGGGEPSASVFKLDILKVFMVGTGILKIF